MDPAGACKGSVMSFVDIILIMKILQTHVLCQLGLPFPTPRQLGDLRQQVPVPREAAAVAGMPGRDVVVKARR